MAADVSSLRRNPNVLITQDLLGGLSRPGNTKNPLDLMSGQFYLRRSNSPTSPMSSSSSSGDPRASAPAPEIQDLNYPPSTLYLGETNNYSLELKLETRSDCTSVCTLDKVKSALQRAEQETTKKRPSPTTQHEEEDEKNRANTTPSSGMFAAACPGCLLYVITQKTNPKCPRCSSMVPCPLPPKRPRIDLNAMQQFV